MSEYKEYGITLPWEADAGLEILMFSHEEHRWNFEHRYMRPDEEHGTDLINNQRLSVLYLNGEVESVDLYMDIVYPKRRGQRFFLGVDVSENSRLFVHFYYEKKESAWELYQCEVGCGKFIPLPEESKLPVPQQSKEFPVKFKLELEHGMFHVPYAGGEFSFPPSLVRFRHVTGG